ncbi:esterase [Pseudomonas brassicacearum]|uniref:Esterase n=1 Tax=Pseudomonas brassicacearum TaxID=930166 RepID=A0A423H046_9PSED|nr:serine hydrolase domain-containing protein [Pseudomonas brassicacearum]RON04009.1 esterase [Pseudomonas brassicacearum]
MRIDTATLEALAQNWVGFVDSGRIVGGVLLLAQDGELRYASARGWADREQRIAVTRDTRFRLASLTKLVTSVTALSLCEQGLLNLDGPISEWLADFRPGLSNGRQASINLRQLLSHTAGLSYGFEQPPGNAYERAGVCDGLAHSGISLAENLQRLARLPLLFEPGSRWQYSLATDVVGALIEQVTGLSLAQACQHWVLAPLGMSASGFAPMDGTVLARVYQDAEGGPRAISGQTTLALDTGRAWLNSERALDPGAYPSGGAGLLSSADDYLRLLECLRLGGAPLLSAATTADLFSDALGGRGIERRGPGWGFGLGTLLLRDPQAAGQPQGAGTWSWCGLYGSHYWVDPRSGLSLVAVTNTGVVGAWGGFADALVEAIYT